MRDVSKFVVVLPGRYHAQEGRRRALLKALEHDYPHYEFGLSQGHALEEAFQVVPVMGVVGSEREDRRDVYLCRPLDPRVVPEILARLCAYEASEEVL